MEDWQKKMIDIEDSSMREMGLNPDAFTREQITCILKPNHAPENYMMDGEITGDEAERYWKEDLKNTGLTDGQVIRIFNRVIKGLA